MVGAALAVSDCPQSAQYRAVGGFRCPHPAQSTASPVPQLVQNLATGSLTKLQVGHFMSAPIRPQIRQPFRRPWPRGGPNSKVEKLTGIEGYRLRVGDWRVVSTLRQEILTVIVIEVGHRREVYE